MSLRFENSRFVRWMISAASMLVMVGVPYLTDRKASAGPDPEPPCNKSVRQYTAKDCGTSESREQLGGPMNLNSICSSSTTVSEPYYNCGSDGNGDHGCIMDTLDICTSSYNCKLVATLGPLGLITYSCGAGDPIMVGDQPLTSKQKMNYNYICISVTPPPVPQQLIGCCPA